ncbi:hypothetical protein JCM5350_007683 [Sporobolomyces pararoseus]
MVSTSSSSTRPRSWTSKLVLTASLLASTTQLASAQSSYAASSSSVQASGSANLSTSAAAASSSSSPSTSTNPLIPNSISPKCHSFLATLNGDSHISSCTAPLLSALDSFQASSSLNSYTPSSSSSVAETLATFCSAPSCDDSKIRSLLNQFNGNCSTELQAGNDIVLGSYDSLYLLTPLKQSICEQDGAGGYCLIDIAKGDVPSSSSATSIASVANSSLETSSSAAASASPSPSALAVNSTGSEKLVMLAATESSSIEAPAPPSLYIQITNVAKRLLRRQQAAAESWSSGSSSSSSSQASPSSSVGGNSSSMSNSTTTSSSSTSFKLPSLLPNSQTYRSMSLPFLFLSSSLPSTTLCTPCTKQILTNYISFESRQPYALGLANSPILGGQGELWQGTGEKCGSGFLSNIMQMSGQQELTGAASSLTTGVKFSAVAIAGVVGWLAIVV